MSRQQLLKATMVLLVVLFTGCAEKAENVVELKHFPLDSTNEIITRTDVEVDRDITTDGKGSLRIQTTERTIIRLFDLDDIDIENGRLIYEAKVRTQNVEGLVYLKMWCHFRDTGEFFSQGLDHPLRGTNGWSSLMTAFTFRRGENPDAVKLQLVIDGPGTVWIDDIHLWKGPPRK